MSQIRQQEGSIKIVKLSDAVIGSELDAWTLQRIVKESVVREVQYQESDPRDQYRGCMVSKTKFVRETVAYAVLERTEHAAMKSLAQQLEEVERARQHAERRSEEALRASQKHEREKNDMADQLENCKGLIRELNIRHDQIGQAHQVIEADLAKVRKSIGEERYNEIVGRKA